MEQFLNNTKTQLSTNKFTTLNIVLGNESCDLDSAISAIVYAAFLKWQYEQIKCKVCTKEKREDSTYKDEAFVPILNVAREDYELKTEVAHCLTLAGITAAQLIFRDDYDFKQLAEASATKVVLVDHHVLANRDQYVTSYVTEIIDHRPLDKSGWLYDKDVRTTIEQVGSCATLVADRIRSLSALIRKEADFFVENVVCADLLHSTIILDTVNFSKEVKKGTLKDQEIVRFLEQILKPENTSEFRCSKLERLVRARTDVSTLSAASLLKKDAKVIGTVLVPSFPILVEDLLKMESLQESIEESLSRNNCTVALLLGMKLEGATARRDAALCCGAAGRGGLAQLSKILEEWTTPLLQLSQVEVNMANCKYYRQLNVAASRKQYVSAVNQFMSLGEINHLREWRGCADICHLKQYLLFYPSFW